MATYLITPSPDHAIEGSLHDQIRDGVLVPVVGDDPEDSTVAGL